MFSLWFYNHIFFFALTIPFHTHLHSIFTSNTLDLISLTGMHEKNVLNLECFKHFYSCERNCRTDRHKMLEMLKARQNMVKGPAMKISYFLRFFLRFFLRCQCIGQVRLNLSPTANIGAKSKRKCNNNGEKFERSG